MIDTGLLDFLTQMAAPRPQHRPWPRFVLTPQGWKILTERLAAADWSLLGLWGEEGQVHAALRDEAEGAIAVVSLPTPDGRFPSLAAVRPGARRLERAVRDLTGQVAEGLDDTRPWLDHGRWPVTAPLADRPGKGGGAPHDYAFLPVEGEGLHRIPVGPVHAGIIEPGHFRFTCAGETVVRLEARLGWVHKGHEALMRGRDVEHAARLAGRLSGDSTVAFAWAFCRAVEAALGVEVPPRATLVRALMAELERIANHLGDFGAICNDAAFAFIQAEASTLRERVARAADTAFGHRLMMDRVVPGGVAVDVKEAGVAAIRSTLGAVADRYRRLRTIYEDKASLLDRTVGTGFLAPDLAHRFGAGGFVGRASGRGSDARKSPGYAPYDGLMFEVPVLADGDVHGRVMVRLLEIEQSLDLVEQILLTLEPGPGRALLAPPGRMVEGMALVEGFRGDCLAWVRLAPDGTVDRAHLRDPSWFQWPLLEAAIEGNIVADFPLCNKSFNCSYSGHDL